jgi:hypothetical protein
MNAADLTTVITPMTVAGSPSQVWRSLMFYEQIDAPPPLLLRLLLPRPLRTEGSKAAVGDQATCLYEGGHLLKRVTEIDKHRLYAFSVVEQQLALGRGILLTGGTYEMRALPDNRTELKVTTHYLSRHKPRWLAEPVERFVCHMFHRHLLRSIRRKALSMEADTASVRPQAE